MGWALEAEAARGEGGRGRRRRWDGRSRRCLWRARRRGCVFQGPRTCSPGPQSSVRWCMVTLRGYTVAAQVAPRRRVWDYQNIHSTGCQMRATRALPELPGGLQAAAGGARLGNSTSGPTALQRGAEKLGEEEAEGEGGGEEEEEGEEVGFSRAPTACCSSRTRGFEARCPKRAKGSRWRLTPRADATPGTNAARTTSQYAGSAC